MKGEGYHMGHSGHRLYYYNVNSVENWPISEEEKGEEEGRGVERGGMMMKTDGQTDEQSFYTSHGRKPPFGRFW